MTWILNLKDWAAICKFIGYPVKKKVMVTLSFESPWDVKMEFIIIIIIIIIIIVIIIIIIILF